MTTTPNTPAAKKTRKIRTAAEVAQDNVDAVTKRVERAKEAAVRANKAFVDAGHTKKLAEGEEAAAKAALDYAKRNPDLKATPQTATDATIAGAVLDTGAMS
jgi:hypothetical protein